MQKKIIILLLCFIVFVNVKPLVSKHIHMDNYFYNVALKGATHIVDSNEKARFVSIDEGTKPIYRQITTPPNLLYIDLPENNTFITDDMGMAVFEIDKFGNVVWEQKQKDKTYFGIIPINLNEIVFNAYSYGRVEKLNKVAGEANIIYDGYMRDIVPAEGGNLLLVGHEDKGKAVIIDVEGKLIWESNPEFYYPRGVWQKEDGNILIVDFRGKAYEIDYYTKNIIWEMKGFNCPNSIQETINKNYLIADEHNNRVVEINPINKKIVRTYSRDLWSPNYARELKNGDWLICDTDNNRVIQINNQDNMVWELSNMHTPNRAVRLEP